MFNLLTWVSTPLVKFGLVVALILGLYGGYKYELHKSYQEGIKTTEIKYEAQILAEKEVLNLKKKSAERDLAIEFAKREGQHNEQIKNLNSTVSGILAGLQSRPSRPVSGSSDNSSTKPEETIQGSTGAGLYKSDAEFLTREAARADEIRLYLIQCYKDYDDVKNSLDNFTNTK